jgi:hypothetical protein
VELTFGKYAISAFVRGKKENRKQKLVNHLFSLESDLLLKALSKAETQFRDEVAHPDKARTVYELGEGATRFQKAVIDAFHIEGDNVVIQIGLIHRDKETLKTRHGKLGSVIRQILLDGQEFLSEDFFFALNTKKRVLFLDDRCPRLILQRVMPQIISANLDAGEFSLSDLQGKVVFKLAPVVKKEFWDTLDRKKQSLKTVSLVLARPESNKKSYQGYLNALQPRDADLIGSILGRILGQSDADTCLEKSPFNRLKVELGVDRTWEKAEELAQARERMTEEVKTLKSDKVLKSASIEYDDLEKYILKGSLEFVAVKNDTISEQLIKYLNESGTLIT